MRRTVYVGMCVLVIVLLAAPVATSQETGTDPPNADTASSGLRDYALYEYDFALGGEQPPTGWRDSASPEALEEYDDLASSTEEAEDRFDEMAAEYDDLEAETEANGLNAENLPLYDQMDELDVEFEALARENIGAYRGMLEIETYAVENPYYAPSDSETESSPSSEDPVYDSGSASGSASETDTGSGQEDSGGWSVSLAGVVVLAALVVGYLMHRSRERELRGLPANSYVESVKSAVRKRRAPSLATVTERPKRKAPPRPKVPAASGDTVGEGGTGDAESRERRKIRRRGESLPDGVPEGVTDTPDFDNEEPVYDEFLEQLGDLQRRGPETIVSRTPSPGAFVGGGTETGDGSVTGGVAGSGGAPPQRSILDEIGYDMTVAAGRGEYEPAVGRESQFNRMLQVLLQSAQGNPVLVGEAGTGKTSIVNELARRLAYNRVPDGLKGRRLVEIRTSQLSAGASLIGQFEEKMERLLAELEASGGRSILFIDEIHTIMGAGVSLGSTSGAADILKPALASGKITVIGATTAEEFRIVEKDAAMKRRFSRIDVPPLSVDETVEVLRTASPKEAAPHRLVVEEDALRPLAVYAERFAESEYLPGSAMKLMRDAVSGAAMRGAPVLTAQDVDRLVHEIYNVEVGSVGGDEMEKLTRLSETLKGRVVGQDHAVDKLVDAISEKRAGIADEDIPVSAVFTGPPGVGKTELAKALASELFGNDTSFLNLALANYKTRESISTLLGSARGYVDSDKGGTLTEFIRRRPYSIVLFDEFEKAHEDILDIFLQILGSGRLSDSQEKVVNCANVIVILTSNLAQTPGQTAEEAKEEMVERGVRPEIADRFGEVVPFRHLTPENVREIVGLTLGSLSKRLASNQDAELVLSDAAMGFLAERGYSEKNGARFVQRVVQTHVNTPLSRLAISGALKGGTVTGNLSEDGESITFSVAPTQHPSAPPAPESGQNAHENTFRDGTHDEPESPQMRPIRYVPDD